MPGNDDEVYAQLRADENTVVEIDMLTFAIFANEKHEWMKHFEEREGRRPNQTEIDSWISNLTEWRFSQMRNEAVQFFDQAARQYLAEEIAQREE